MKIDPKMAKILVKKIKESEYIIIAKHKNPDWDAQGSALGLAWIIQDSFKNKKIYVVGERLNDDQNFLPQDLSDEIVRQALLITVDTAAQKLIDFDRVPMVKEIFKVDHHLNVDPFGTNNLVDETAIANTQLLTLWAEDRGLTISEQAAWNLYHGLVTDSGRFLFQRTDEETFRAAAILVSTGIDLDEIYTELYLRPLKVKQWQNAAFKKMKVTKKGIAYIVVGPQDYNKFNLDNDGEVKSALGLMAGNEEIVAWAFICEYKDGEIRISLRSRDFDVASVAKNYQGGGHKLAAGGKLTSLEEVPNLVKDLEKLVS